MMTPSETELHPYFRTGAERTHARWGPSIQVCWQHSIPVGSRPLLGTLRKLALLFSSTMKEL